ncbi:hypothetical protein FRC03_002440, partial [Tulasnella sp. 419]
RLKVQSVTEERNSLYRTVQEASGRREIKESRSKTSNAWSGRKVLLGADLELDESKKRVLEASITRNGGQIVNGEKNWEEADVYVTRFRGSDLYYKFLELGRTVGTVAWVLFVEQTGRLTRPLDQLLHFPVPPYPIRGFEKYEITITNYVGDGREYLKKLMQLMGAQFTAPMSSKNTHVIAAHPGGDKARKASEWNLPVVNHVWLEDCFISWSNLPTGGIKGSKYSLFPPGVNYMTILGDRGFGGFAEEMLRAGIGCPVPRHERHGTSGISSGSPSGSAAPPAGQAGPSPARTQPSSSSAQRQSPQRTQGLHQPVAASERDGRTADGSGVATSSSAKQPRMDDMEVVEALLDDDNGASEPVPRNTNGRKRSETDDDVIEIIDPVGKGKGLSSSKSTHTVASSSRVNPSAASKSKENGLKPTSSNVEREKGFGSTVRKPVSNTKTRIEFELSDDDHVEDVDILFSKSKSSNSNNAGPSSSHTTGKPSSSKRHLDAHSSGDEMGIKDRSSKNASVPSPSKRPAIIDTSPVVSKYGKATSSTSQTRTLIDSPPASKKRKIGPASVVASGRGMSSPRAASSKSPPKVDGPSLKKPRGHQEVEEEEDEEDQDAEDEESPPEPILFSRSKRSAATAAQNKLRDVIMPDVVKFEKTMKASQGDVRRMSWGIREPASKTLKKAKKRSREEDESSGIEEIDDIPTKSDKKGKGKANSLSDEESGRVSKKTTDGRGKSMPSRKARNDEPAKIPNTKRSVQTQKDTLIRFVTTGCELEDEDVKALSKLGAKQTGDVRECTHLIAKSIVRTLKFMCALARGVHIVSPDWVRQSAKAKRLLDETDFQLQDPAGEKKHNFKLSESLARARRRRIFKSHIFYVTPSVQTDKNILRDIVACNGGETVMQVPKPRALEGKRERYLISCAQDKAHWLPLIQRDPKIAVYTPEFVLHSALLQELDLSAHRVEGSVELARAHAHAGDDSMDQDED